MEGPYDNWRPTLAVYYGVRQARCSCSYLDEGLGGSPGCLLEGERAENPRGQLLCPKLLDQRRILGVGEARPCGHLQDVIACLLSPSSM